MPVLRGAVSKQKKMILTHDDSADVLQFVNSNNATKLTSVGAACPDHLVHTKMLPLFIDWDPQSNDVEALLEKIQAGITQFETEYKAYFEANKTEGDVMFEAAPRVILIPGIGMINTGKSWTMSQLSGALYHRAIAVMRGATALGEFVSLSANESYNVEYWPLELYKLTLAPAEAEFSRKIAFVTGGAGGIGSKFPDGPSNVRPAGGGAKRHCPSEVEPQPRCSTVGSLARYLRRSMMVPVIGRALRARGRACSGGHARGGARACRASTPTTASRSAFSRATTPATPITSSTRPSTRWSA